MLPDTGDILQKNFVIQKQPSKTYHLKDGRVRGYVDGLEAVKQSVYCILSTEKFEHVIFSRKYGREFQNLYGGSMNVIKSKVKKRIREALMRDNRVQSVEAFSFSQDQGKLLVSFTVHAVSGNFTAETEVMANV